MRDTSATAPMDGLAVFIVLAWGTTWLLILPMLSSMLRDLPPQPYMLALAGLSAFGPSFAAFVAARREGQLRSVFGAFSASPLWVATGLVVPLCLHLIARLLEFALGGDVARWFWLPRSSSQVAALILFSLGEEFGWRGFAHPRLLDRYGPIIGPFVTGLIWGIWHLGYEIASDGTLQMAGFMLMLLEFLLWSSIIAWFFERTRRSMAVAISIHAGGHLDKAQVASGEWRLRALTLLVLAVAALLATRSLKAMCKRKAVGIPRLAT